MSGDFDAAAISLIQHVLELHARLQTQPRLAFDAEHARLKQRLLDDFRGEGIFRLARYAIVCWIDEVFLDSTWSKAWRRQTLEASLYGTDEGATRFWTLAQQAARTGPREMRQLLRWLVLLGFRGSLRGKEDEVKAWLETLPPMERELPRFDEDASSFHAIPPSVPLEGRRTLRRWLAVAGAGLAVVAPIMGFLAAKHWLP
ncbi:MAG: DotU family type IV/VI secretion system protein [Gemmataceae bacterium]|nr:DotU family type IV/VI secretion system protein [Gemmataceae bacterium]